MLGRLSLRARLVLGVVVLAAAGLLVADAATYTLLKSNLVDRVDKTLDDDEHALHGRDRGAPPGLFVQVRSLDGRTVYQTRDTPDFGENERPAPQLPLAGDHWYLHADAVAELVARVGEDEQADPARLYLTGFSFGGNGREVSLRTLFPSTRADLYVAPVAGSAIPNQSSDDAGFVWALVHVCGSSPPTWQFVRGSSADSRFIALARLRSLIASGEPAVGQPISLISIGVRCGMPPARR